MSSRTERRVFHTTGEGPCKLEKGYGERDSDGGRRDLLRFHNVRERRAGSEPDEGGEQSSGRETRGGSDGADVREGLTVGPASAPLIPRHSVKFMNFDVKGEAVFYPDRFVFRGGNHEVHIRYVDIHQMSIAPLFFPLYDDIVRIHCCRVGCYEDDEDAHIPYYFNGWGIRDGFWKELIDSTLVLQT